MNSEYYCIVNKTEREDGVSRVLDELNTQDVANTLFPRACLHTLFETHAAQNPDAVALIFESEQLSFRHLNERANQFAHYLIANGVKRESRVAICIERSVELIVVLISILKAGAAYVPLAPEYPVGRLRYMLENSSASFLIADRVRGREILNENSDIRLLEAQQDERDIYSISNLIDSGYECVPENLAYVIHTSGSTGNPKGVAVEHRSVVNLVMWIKNICNIGPGDLCLHKAPLSFDASVSEIFLPLLTGATLVVARPGGHKEPPYLIELICRHCITFVQFVPSTLAAFLEDSGACECTSLRRVQCGGEVLTPALSNAFHSAFPHLLLQNVYGPTEATVDATAWFVGQTTPDKPVPIGIPLSNMTAYILDENVQIVPPGVEGELYLGGVGIARGYINQPGLTAARFVADPFATEPGARMYRTGDLAKWSISNGAIEYFGRNDMQVKIRGHRIELNEIAIRLAEQEEVREAIVICASDVSGQPYLVAYYVCDHQSGATVGPRVLYAHLSGLLPEYMIPKVYVQLDSFPLSAHGKLDRTKLPPPGRNSYIRGTQSVFRENSHRKEQN
jgi:amino acid adenylation domain-containing protein